MDSVEKWTEVHSGIEYVCFRNSFGELFHFRKNVLKRGKPCAPFNTIEEFTRPYTLLTVENAARIAGVEWTTMIKYVRDKRLRTTKKVWSHGRQHRHGLLIDLFDLQEWAAKRAFETRLGKRIDWDTSALGLLEGE